MKTFKCKECDAEVTYQPQHAPGGIGFQTKRLADEITVYLTCSRGHVHPYVVKQQEEKNSNRGG
ncbi:hypothetical protein BH11PSE9_BH11PSE9_30200 [soil metagenome]